MSLPTLITFVIPSIGRPSLATTLQSLQRQTCPLWKAIVVFDGIPPSLTVSDERIELLSIPKTGSDRSAGEVRNHGLALVKTPWAGFVDDDDTLNPNYVSHVQTVSMADVIVFRMIRNPDGRILPPLGETEFKAGQVGISFCMKASLLQEGFTFQSSTMEDFQLLDRLRTAHKKIILSDQIMYHERW